MASAPGRAGSSGIGRALGRALAVVSRSQLPTGEMPVYFPARDRGLTYARSVPGSVLVSEALACLDPTSPWARTDAFDRLHASERPALAREVVAIRRRIRGFVRWQEEPDGSWRFTGRASGTAPDVETTVGAAILLAEAPARADRRPWARHQESVGRLLERPGGDPGPVGWALALRFLSVVGGDTRGVRAGLRAALEHGGPAPVGGRLSHPLAPALAVGRAAALGCLDDDGTVREWVLDGVLGRAEGEGGFGDPLSTALALVALAGLGYRGPEVAAGHRALLDDLSDDGTVLHHRLFEGGAGSPACTAALAMEALVLSAAASGGGVQ